MTQETLIRLECIRCGTVAEQSQFQLGCPVCAEQGKPANLTTVYDLEQARSAFKADNSTLRSRNMWRYDALLPFSREQAVSLEEGGTPLVAVPRLAELLGVRALWLKDESRNPTWSFKDRASSIAATHARLLNSPALVVASTGNAAAATAAYARRAGLPAIVLFAKSVDPIMSAFVRSYGALVVATPTKSDRWVLMKHCVESWGCYPAGSYVDPPVGNNPYMMDGYKTVGYEIWEQLGRRTPDWIFGPTGYTNCMFGIYKSFQELKALGLVTAGPRLGVAEAYGSLSQALEEGSDTIRPAAINRPTVAISMGTAQNAYQGLATVRQSNGSATQVSNEQILAAQKLLVETEGIFGETASVTGLAALMQRLEEGRVERNSEIVLVLTSTGLKTLGVTSDLKADPPLAEDVAAFTHLLKNTYGFEPGS